jgi:hypothetical protein
MSKGVGKLPKKWKDRVMFTQEIANLNKMMYTQEVFQTGRGIRDVLWTWVHPRPASLNPGAREPGSRDKGRCPGNGALGSPPLVIPLQFVTNKECEGGNLAANFNKSWLRETKVPHSSGSPPASGHPTWVQLPCVPCTQLHGWAFQVHIL